MRRTARTVFQQFAADLEAEPGHWGMRLFEAHGGLVWRNRAHREFFEPLGFYGSSTLPWAGVKSYFTADELRGLQAAYAAAFAQEIPVSRWIEFGNHGCLTRFFAVYGNLNHGVVVTHSEPSSYRAVRSCSQAGA